MRNARPTKIVVSYRGSDKVKSYAALGLEPHGGHLHILSSTLGPSVLFSPQWGFCSWLPSAIGTKSQLFVLF